MMTQSTPDRLIDAALALFAQNGFAGTSVGDIEEAAGFTRRGGTVYKHFRSKDGLFDAVIDRHARTMTAAGDISQLLPLGDLRAELTLVARFLLTELDTHEQVHRALERAGPDADGARERMLQEVLEPGYERMGGLLQRWVGDRPLDDGRVTMMLLLGGLVNLRRNLWTFGRVPLSVSDDRAIGAWVDIAVAVITNGEPSSRRDSAT
jgi:AcrR family transcriptional regulator